MKYTNKYGTVDFWDPYEKQLDKLIKEGNNKVMIQFSGGADSTLMFYLLQRELNERKMFDTEIVCTTLVAEEKAANVEVAKILYLEMQELFPNLTYSDHEIMFYSEHAEPIKQIPHSRFNANIREKTGVRLNMSGRTANPPYEEALKHDLLDKREIIRDVSGREEEVELLRRQWYGPLQLVDKRWIAQMYIDFDLEHIAKQTASCIGWEYDTANFTEPCRKCWWCREKKWAMGYYDGGVQ